MLKIITDLFKKNMKRFKSQKKAYLHINNGGISFHIEENRFVGNEMRVCPELVIESKHFGYQTNQMRLPMSIASLETLGLYLLEQSKEFKQHPSYLEAELNSPLEGKGIEVR